VGASGRSEITSRWRTLSEEHAVRDWAQYSLEAVASALAAALLVAIRVSVVEASPSLRRWRRIGMEASLALLVVGVALAVLQDLSAPGNGVEEPWHFAPLFAGSCALFIGFMLGIALGSGLYRLAIGLELASIAAFGLGLFTVIACCAAPYSPPEPSLLFEAGLALAAVGFVLSLVAIVRSGSGRQPDDIQ
jgi:hypothetical protein